MTINGGYYVADCARAQMPVAHKDADTFYLPINIQGSDGQYSYEEYRFNLPVNYPIPPELLEYLANTLDEYRAALKEVGVV